jgi:acyl-CoA thioester hydrolase
MFEVYRGSANTWECDEMGHMNVRFYVARMMEGLAEFAALAGMPDAFRERGQSTLRPRDQHIRYLREARAGEPFVMHAGVLDVREDSVLLYQQIDHASGEVCATLRTWVDHVDLGNERAFPWSAGARAFLQAAACEPPARLAPRSLDPAIAPLASPRLARCDDLGAPLIGRGVIRPDQCDHRGWMFPEFVQGRVSDSVGHLLRTWREKTAPATSPSGKAVRVGGAVVEARIVYRRWPRAGDRYVIRTGLAYAAEKTHSLVHWMMDPERGDAWATTQVVAVSFDLDARKIIPAPTDQIEALKTLAPIGLEV